MSMPTIDRNERVLTLDSRHLENNAERIISSIVEGILEENRKKNPDKLSDYDYKIFRATKNALFLKYIGTEFEGFTDSIFIDRRLREVVRELFA